MKAHLVLASTAAILVAAVFVYFLARPAPTELRRVATDEPHAKGGEIQDAAVTSAVGDAAPESVRRTAVTEQPPADRASGRGTSVLRVVLEGITEEDTRNATVAVAGRRAKTGWRYKVEDSWPARGLTSEYDLDPFFARLEERVGEQRYEQMRVEVDHPLYFRQTVWVPFADGVVSGNGQTVYEVRMELLPPALWPDLSLAVKDANTHEHLENVELRCVSTAYMGVGQQPGQGDPYTSLGDALDSPIALRGGYETNDPEARVAGLALPAVSGEAPQLVTLGDSGRPKVERGLVVFARAPGYAWGRIIIDLSAGGDREVLLGPEAALEVRLANVQFGRYAALDMQPRLIIGHLDRTGDTSLVWHQDVDEALEAEGLRLIGLLPGELDVKVELSPSWRRKPTPLAREVFSLGAGEDRDLLVALADAPDPPTLAKLGGVVSFPNFGGEEDVRLELFRSDYRYGDPDHELSLAEMEPVAAELPTWSFHLEDVPVGRHQIRLRPFQKSWMIELPAGGREDVELVIPEFAEVLVETLDAETGQRIPVETIAYRTLEDLPDQVTRGGPSSWSIVGCEDGPGRFRFWGAPGAVHVTTWGVPDGLDLGDLSEEVQLVPGLQSVRLELAPACRLRVEFRVDGAALPYEDKTYHGLSSRIHAIGHDGRVGGMYPYWLVSATEPGLYEINFEGVGTDRFLPIPPRRIEVRAGETTDVIVDLRRK